MGREIHPLDPQPHRYCMLASTASAPRVTRCSLGLYWSRDLCSNMLTGWLGDFVLSRSDSERQRNLMMQDQCPLPVYYNQVMGYYPRPVSDRWNWNINLFLTQDFWYTCDRPVDKRRLFCRVDAPGERSSLGLGFVLLQSSIFYVFLLPTPERSLELMVGWPARSGVRSLEAMSIACIVLINEYPLIS